MRIAIDVDGVLADHFGLFCQQYHEATNVSLSRSDLPTWDVRLPGTDAEILSLIDARLESPAYLEALAPIPGAAEAMQSLQRSEHDTAIATHRPAHTHQTTREWLDEHYIPYSQYVDDVPQNKGSLDVDVLVDDYHSTVDNALCEGIDAYLFLQPWNQRYAAEVPRSQVVTSWPDFLSNVSVSLD